MKTVKRWVVMSVPGDDRNPSNWYAYDRTTCQSVRCDDLDDARRVCVELNGVAS